MCNLHSKCYCIDQSTITKINNSNITVTRNYYNIDVFSIDYNQNTIIQFIKDISVCIYFMSGYNLIHGSIIPSNVVYANENHFLLVDTSQYLLNNNSKTFDISFMSQFYSPEYLCDKQITIENDIWGFGCILAFITSGTLPINIMNQHTVSVFNYLSESIKVIITDIIKGCMNHNQFKRITPYELILYNESISNIIIDIFTIELERTKKYQIEKYCIYIKYLIF